jgi:uncharacterized membrane protein YdbT with pleckstrin-like domain
MASYIEDTLIQGENILHRGQLSLWMLWRPIAMSIVLLASGIGVAFTPLHYGVALALGAAGLGYGLSAYIRHISTEVALTNKRLVSKTGFLSRNTSEINLTKVEGLQVQQSGLGIMFKFGTITFSGTGTAHAPLVGLRDPSGFRRAFMEALEANKRGGK